MKTGITIEEATGEIADLAPCGECGSTERRTAYLQATDCPTDLFCAVLNTMTKRMGRAVLVDSPTHRLGWYLAGALVCDHEGGLDR